MEHLHESGNGNVTRVNFRHDSNVPEEELDCGCDYRHITAMILRRLGPDPHANGAKTSSLQGCPDILELSTGDFAVIGVDITESTLDKLAFGAGCGPDEKIVRIPRKTLVLAKPDIPNAV